MHVDVNVARESCIWCDGWLIIFGAMGTEIKPLTKAWSGYSCKDFYKSKWDESRLRLQVAGCRLRVAGCGL
jgi:hypothetical protein